MHASDLTADELDAAAACFRALADAFEQVRAHKTEIACRRWATDLGGGIARVRAQLARLRTARPGVAPGRLVGDLIEIGQVIREQVCFAAIVAGIEDELDEMEDEPGRMLLDTLHFAVRDARGVELRLTEIAKGLSQMKEEDV